MGLLLSINFAILPTPSFEDWPFLAVGVPVRTGGVPLSPPFAGERGRVRGHPEFNVDIYDCYFS